MWRGARRRCAGSRLLREGVAQDGRCAKESAGVAEAWGAGPGRAYGHIKTAWMHAVWI